MTLIYLASSAGKRERESILSYISEARRPNLLISFAAIKAFERPGILDKMTGFRKMLDSGAFSASTKGVTIRNEDLIKAASSGSWAEVVALDVIGDPEASMRNARVMAATGVDCIPTFHYGEPWEFLTEYCREFGKVGLGGLARLNQDKDRLVFIEQCFSRAWPFKAHLFGVVAEEMLMRFPFHSADSTGWMWLSRYNRWWFANAEHLKIPKNKMPTNSLRPEIDHYLRIEERVKARWAGEFKKQGWI